MSASSLRIVVSGRTAGVDGQGGATWAVLQYVLGLRGLGHDVLLVEPVDFGEETDGPRATGGNGRGSLVDSPEAAYFRRLVERFGLEGRAALVEPRTRATVGCDYTSVVAFARSADLLFNLSGLLADPEILAGVERRVYLDLDPAFTQLWATVEGLDMGFGGHDVFVTVGLSVGLDGCPVPTCGKSWIRTLQPVVLDEWPRAMRPGSRELTTVANWRGYGSIHHDGVHYGQKAHALRRLVALPRLTDVPLRLALSIDPGEVRDLDLLREHGWRLTDPARAAGTPDRYRAFVRRSMAELGIAKTGYTLSRCGWFSDRSACYLASGRPVLAEDTGYADHLPTGEGLFVFRDEDDVLDGIEALRSDYDRHARAARDLAEARFASGVVLGSLLDEVTSAGGGSNGDRSPAGSTPDASGRGRGVPGAPSHADVRALVEAGLEREGRGAAGVSRIDRRPSRYGTSHLLEEVDVVLEDGTRLELILKDVGPHGVLGEASRTKPRFLSSPSREIATYRWFLAPWGIGPRLHAAQDEPELGRHRLLLGRVRGVELYQVGEISMWEKVARWLARFHLTFVDDLQGAGPARTERLLVYDRAFLGAWYDRAVAFSGSDPGATPEARRRLIEIRERRHEYVDRILSGPATLVHGEFYASNVLVRSLDDGGIDVRPVDWEMAGIGAGLLDLAALVAGRWSPEARTRIANAYFEETSSSSHSGARGETRAAFFERLHCCRLQVALQWLGWAPGWRPPEEHSQDWLAEAIGVFDELESGEVGVPE